MSDSKAHIPIDIGCRRHLNPALSSVEISRRAIAESYRNDNRMEPCKGDELAAAIEMSKQRSAMNAGKYLVVGAIYALGAGAWFALKS